MRQHHLHYPEPKLEFSLLCTMVTINRIESKEPQTSRPNTNIDITIIEPGRFCEKTILH